MENNYNNTSLKVCACVVPSVMSDSATPWTMASQAPLSMGFSRQEYWSGCRLFLSEEKKQALFQA